MRSSWDIVIRGLMVGQEIELEYGKDSMYTFVMLDGVDGHKKLAVKMTEYETNEPHYVVPDVHFNDFIVMCGKLPEDRLLEIASNTALIDINRNPNRK